MRPSALLLVVVVLAPCPAVAGGSGRELFVRSWEGRRVTVTHPLYTLIYNERGKLGTTRSGRREGLTVITPSNGVYFQFDGRQGKDDVVGAIPQRIMAAVTEAYGPDALDVRAYRKIEPVAVHQFSVGAKLIVGRIRIDRDTVKVGFVQAGEGMDDEPVTSLTIKWPLPLSKSFSESDNIDALIRTYVEPEPIS
jgi:hypothetical protein